MAEKSRSILHVNAADIAGGAEKAALDLFQACRARGHGAWLAVGDKRGGDPDVLALNMNCGVRAARILRAILNRVAPLSWKDRGIGRLLKYLHWIEQPKSRLEVKLGHEDFEFPRSGRLLQLPPARPDIIHCHNLHGGYFDLRALSRLSRQVPVVLTLHDAWLLGGHCAHSFGCERWKTGCGNCPDLGIYPALRRDGTAYNWRRKKYIYARSRLYVTTPSQWLMRKVEQSNLTAGIVKARVIANGVDLSVFRPGNKRAARAFLGIPPDARVLLF